MNVKGHRSLPSWQDVDRQARRWWRDLQPKVREPEAEPAITARHDGDQGDPAALARLRRPGFVSEAMAEEATLDLFRQLGLTAEQARHLPRVAVIAMALAHVREDPPPNENGWRDSVIWAVGRKTLDDEDSAKMKPLRFRRLLACRDDEDLAREMRRLVALAGQRLNVGDLAVSRRRPAENGDLWRRATSAHLVPVTQARLAHLRCLRPPPCRPHGPAHPAARQKIMEHLKENDRRGSRPENRHRGPRADRRVEVMTEAGRSWLLTQAARNGFDLPAPEAIRVDGYDQLRLPRRTRARCRQKEQDIRISVLDLDGVLEVREPDRFLSAVVSGFGKARAFGCGPMLIRRA